jgi:hypothetical protein
MRINNIQIATWELIEPDNIDKNTGNIIGIPNKYIDELMYSHTGSNPMIIELTNEHDHKHLCSSFEIIEFDVVIIPYWLLSKLNLVPFNSVISIENNNKVETVDYIKVIANSSRYSQWDEVQYTLESILSSQNAINKGDPLNILGVEFYVLELKDTNGLNIEGGSIFNTDVKIDFDIPMDDISDKYLPEKKKEIDESLQQKKADDVDKKQPLINWRLDFDEGMPVISKPEYIKKEDDNKFKGSAYSLKR